MGIGQDWHDFSMAHANNRRNNIFNIQLPSFWKIFFWNNPERLHRHPKKQ
jgi:hypothetical protein